MNQETRQTNTKPIVSLIFIAILIAGVVYYGTNEYLLDKPDECSLDRRAVNDYRSKGQYNIALDLLEVYKSCMDAREDSNGYGMGYFYHLGWTYQQMGRHNDAISTYTAGIPEQPDYPYLYYRRALSYEAINNPQRAISDMRFFYNLAIEKDPDQFEKVLNDYPDIREKLVEYKLVKEDK